MVRKPQKLQPVIEVPPASNRRTPRTNPTKKITPQSQQQENQSTSSFKPGISTKQDEARGGEDSSDSDDEMVVANQLLSPQKSTSNRSINNNDSIATTPQPSSVRQVDLGESTRDDDREGERNDGGGGEGAGNDEEEEEEIVVQSKSKPLERQSPSKVTYSSRKNKGPKRSIEETEKGETVEAGEAGEIGNQVRQTRSSIPSTTTTKSTNQKPQGKKSSTVVKKIVQGRQTTSQPPPPPVADPSQHQSLPTNDEDETNDDVRRGLSRSSLDKSGPVLKKRRRNGNEDRTDELGTGVVVPPSQSANDDGQVQLEPMTIDDEDRDTNEQEEEQRSTRGRSTTSSTTRRRRSSTSTSTTNTKQSQNETRSTPIMFQPQTDSSTSTVGQKKEKKQDPDRPLNPSRPKSFMHWSYNQRKCFVPDKIYLHKLCLLSDEMTREDMKECIEREGGEVVEKMKEAEIVVLPPWYEDGYEELYWKAEKKNLITVQESWLQTTFESNSSPSSSSYRSNPLSDLHVPPRPKSKPSYLHRLDSPTGRLVDVPRYTLKPEEEEYLERLRKEEKKVRGSDTMRKLSEREIMRKAEGEFFDKYHRTSEDYRIQFPEFLRRQEERELNRLPAKKRAREVKRRRKGKGVEEEEGEGDSDEEEEDREEEGGNNEDASEEAREDDEDQLASEDEDSRAHEEREKIKKSIDALARRFRQSRPEIESLYFYTSLDMTKVVEKLELVNKARDLFRAGKEAEAKVCLETARLGLWTFEDDEDLLEMCARYPEHDLTNPDDPIRNDGQWNVFENTGRPDEVIARRIEILGMSEEDWSSERGEEGRIWRRKEWIPPTIEELKEEMQKK